MSEVTTSVKTKVAHPSRMQFGKILNLTFKIYFSDFWRNIGAVTLIFGVAIICMIPIIIAFIAGVSFEGYPFFDFTDIELSAFLVGYVFFVLAASIFVPSFITAYIGPKTIDYLEQKPREKGERTRMMFKVLGRTASAQTAFMLIYFVLFGYAIYESMSMVMNIDVMQFVYTDMEELNRINLIAQGLSLGVLAVFFLFAFAKQTALFEHRCWFGALGKSLKTLFTGNFWATLGQFIVFGLMLISAYYFVIVIVAFIIVIIGMLTVGASMISTMGTTLDAGLIAGIVVIGAVLMALIAAIYSVFYGLINVFTTLLYFNARTTSEQIPFPGYVEPSKEEQA